MNRKRTAVVAVAVASFALLTLWPTRGFDRDKVHPSLLQLALPIRTASCSVLGDGGSLGIEFNDQKGRTLQFALPISESPGRKYPKLFVGATQADSPAAIEVEAALVEDTRRDLVECIEGTPNPGPEKHFMLFALRGAPRDYVRLGIDWLSDSIKALIP